MSKTGWKALAIDALLSISVLGAVAAWLAPRASLHTRLIGGGPPITPSDINGTLWFYWWAERALSRGQDLQQPDMICAPTGQALGSNFPQHVDAHLAGPFLANLPFPLSYNLFVLAVPVLGGLGAYAGLRMLKLGRAVSLMVAVLYGFNALSIHELANGKPASALVLATPIVMAAWLRCLSAPGRRFWPWLVIAGFAGALAIQAYVLYALLIAFFAAGAGLLHLWRPAPGIGRRRVVWAVLLVTGLSLALSGSYLGRLLGERRPMPANASHLRMDSPAVLRTQAESLHLAYPLMEDPDEERPKRSAFPGALTIAALVLLPLGGWRSRRWLAASLGFFLLSLGPMAAWSVRPEVEWLTLFNRAIPLPTSLLFEVFPFAIQFFHPGRVLPMVVLCLGTAVAVGLHGLSDRLPRFGVPAIAVILTGLGMAQVHAQGGLELPHTAFSVHPFIAQLAEEPGDFGIIEFPVGLGHATAPAQLIHQKARSESHHDGIAGLLQGIPPEDCLQLPLLQALWDLSRGDAPAPTGPRPIAPDMSAAAFATAHAAGFRYLVAWRPGFDVLSQAGLDVDREVALRQIRRRLGAPIYRDETIEAWALPADGRP
jgi:hypothetical protein